MKWLGIFSLRKILYWMLERTIVLDGLSKTYAMTGWRLGYVIGPREDVRALQKAFGNWQVEVMFKNEDKDGARLFGRGFACSANYVAAGVCSTTTGTCAATVATVRLTNEATSGCGYGNVCRA